jgi:phage terminase small subunit
MGTSDLVELALFCDKYDVMHVARPFVRSRGWLADAHSRIFVMKFVASKITLSLFVFLIVRAATNP